MTLTARRRLPLAALAAASLLAGTACGSTVGGVASQPERAASAAQSGSGLGDAGPAGPAGTASGVLGGTDVASGSVGSTSGSGPGSGPGAGSGAATEAGQAEQPAASSGGPATVASGGSSGRVPGVTDRTIKFGVSYTKDAGAQNAVLGAGGLDEGDARSYYDAVTKQINDAGGVAGRRLVPSYFNAAGYDDSSSTLQAACEKWTKDDPVFVMFDGIDNLLRQCAKKAGIVSLSAGASNATARTFAEFPHHIEPSSLRLDRATGVTVEGLARTDYYGKAPVIGIAAWDDSDYRRAVEGTMVPALKRLGFAPTPPQYIAVPESEQELGDSSASVSAAVLKMRSDGVTHVFLVDGPAGVFGGTGLTLLFIRAASGQNWVPRYGFSDANNAQSGMDAGLWTAQDIKGSRAVSAGNSLDASDAGTRPNRERIACLDLMKRNGIEITNANARTAALNACEYIWFVKRVLGTRLAPVDQNVFVRAVNALGTAYASPRTYRTRFAPDRHDGAGAARTMALDESGCGCFVYTSAPYALP